MNKNKSLKDRLVNKKYIGFVIAIISLWLLALIGWGIYNKVNEGNNKDIAVVSFGDGENKIEVNRNGDVKIQTPFGTYYQRWSKEKIENFFSKFNKLDFDQLTSFVGEGLMIELTTGNGTVISFAYYDGLEEMVKEMQEELEETYRENKEELNIGKYQPDYYFQDNINEYGQAELSDENEGEMMYFGEGEDLGRGDSYEENNENPWNTSNIGADDKNFECKEIDPVTGKKIIISNTVCGK